MDKLNALRWNTKRLDEILTPEQIESVWNLYRILGHDEPVFLKVLLTYIDIWKSDLEKKGVDARFLTYLLFAKLTNKLVE